MFRTYLARELLNRRKQTIIIAMGMALAIALVIVVNSVSAGVTAAQSKVLSTVYGVGTDVTVTKPATTANAGPQQFAVGATAGTTSGQARTVSQNILRTDFGTSTYASSALAKVRAVDDVKAATGILSLQNTSFSGTLPTFQTGSAPRGGAAPPTGGTDGAGGSAFSVSSTTVIGLDAADLAIGPLSSSTVTKGRSFAAGDENKDVVVLDASYAKSKSLAVGKTTTIGGTTFTIIGIVASTSSDAKTAANEYIPLSVAQTLSGNVGKVSSIYVQASSSAKIAQVQAGIEKALPKYTVNTQAQLAATVSGSLSTASGLISNLGTWLSIVVLAAAFLTAILFTISGVTRRTREFGTLKAIGWKNARIVRQVAGESMVQGLLGGLLGVVLGIVAIVIVNAYAPTLSAATAAPRGPAAGALIAGPPSGAPGAAPTAASTVSTTVALHLPLALDIVVIAVGLALIGGLVAGAMGGWRAAGLRPAEALRSVA